MVSRRSPDQAHRFQIWDFLTDWSKSGPSKCAAVFEGCETQVNYILYIYLDNGDNPCISNKSFLNVHLELSDNVEDLGDDLGEDLGEEIEVFLFLPILLGGVPPIFNALNVDKLWCALRRWWSVARFLLTFIPLPRSNFLKVECTVSPNSSTDLTEVHCFWPICLNDGVLLILYFKWQAFYAPDDLQIS